MCRGFDVAPGRGFRLGTIPGFRPPRRTPLAIFLRFLRELDVLAGLGFPIRAIAFPTNVCQAIWVDFWAGRHAMAEIPGVSHSGVEAHSQRPLGCNYSIRWFVIQEVFDNVEFGVESKSASPGTRMGLDGAAVRLVFGSVRLSASGNFRIDILTGGAAPESTQFGKTSQEKNGPAIFCFARSADEPVCRRFARSGEEAPSLVGLDRCFARIWSHVLLGSYPSAA